MVTEREREGKKGKEINAYKKIVQFRGWEKQKFGILIYMYVCITDKCKLLSLDFKLESTKIRVEYESEKKVVHKKIADKQRENRKRLINYYK